MGLKIALDCISSQLLFSCNKTRKQCGRLPLKAPEEDKDEVEEATASQATAAEDHIKQKRKERQESFCLLTTLFRFTPGWLEFG